MVPTKERNHSAVFIRYKSEGILLDCGEGTQRQMKLAGIALPDVTKIFLSHWHGDHVLGLPGLLQSLSASGYEKVLKIWGPKGSKKRIEKMMEAFVFEINFEIEVNELLSGICLDTLDFYIEAEELDHGIPTFGFRFVEKDRRRIKVSEVKKLGIPEGPLLGDLQKGKNVEFKGKKILAKDVTYVVAGKTLAFIWDTILCENCYKLAKDADLLVCEAAYASALEDKAIERKHLTAQQAGLIASKSEVKRLILTHFSARYKDITELTEDVKTVFPEAECAYDFLKLTLK